MEDNNENLDELEAQLRASLEEIRLKKLRLQEEREAAEEAKRQAEYARLQAEAEARRNAQVNVTVREIIDWIHVLFTVGLDNNPDSNREDVANWLRQTYVVSEHWKHSKYPKAFIVDARYWNVVVEGLNKFNNVAFFYDNNTQSEIEEAKNAPQFTVDEHKEGFKVIIHPTADWYAQSNIQSIPGSKPVAGTHSKEWVIPYIYSFILIQKLSESKVKFTEKADKRIKDEMALRDELDRIAKLVDTDEIKVDFKNGIVPRAFQKVGGLFGLKRDGNFICADEMGLGKTLQSILVGILLSQKWGRPCRDLIVCPAGLKENWYRELFKLLEMEAVVLSGAIPDEHDMIMLMVKRPPIVIINYDLIGKAIELKGQTKTRVNENGVVEKIKEQDKTKWPWVELLNACGFDRIIYDEAHKLKNADSKRSQASRLITIPRVTILTGTPITNRPQEYWPLLALVAPDQIPNREQFESRYVSLDKKRAANVDELRHVVKQFMVRRTKKEVVADLPPINRITDYHQLSEQAVPIYQKAEDGLYQTLKEYDPERKDEDQLISGILVQILRMKQICAWDKIDTTCDLATAKLDSFEEGELNNKIIIFTQFAPLVDEFRKRMSGDFGTVAFTGENEMKYRYDQCDRFQNDPAVRVMVTTPRVAGEGYTLTRGGAVIFNDFEWTPAAHEQAEARCYGRINDMHGATSYYRATANTIEDLIQEILLRKMQIIEQVVDGVAIARNEDSSIVKEVIKRLKEGR